MPWIQSDGSALNILGSLYRWILSSALNIGDNTYIENCIVESRDTIRANTSYIGEDGAIKIVVEKNERYVL